MSKKKSTPEIDVSVSTEYLAEHSDPKNNQYVFSYTITLRNYGQIPAKLLSRHWLIVDAEGKAKEVEGNKVVGEHPYLKPGSSFKYKSGAVLSTPFGCVHGSYELISENGETFFTPIESFNLSLPNTIH